MKISQKEKLKLYKAHKKGYQITRLHRKRKLVDHLGGKCIDCGFDAHLAALDFDHVDPKTKKANIGELLNNPELPFWKILEEADKCVLRCANCHRIKTHPNATD